MKNILLFVFIVLSINLVQAQDFSIQPNPSVGSAVLDQPNTEPGDIVAHATMTNNADIAKTYSWTRNVISKPDVWKTAVCDVNTCYAPHVNGETFTLNPGQSAIMDVHAYASGNPGDANNAEVGEAVVEVIVKEVDNEENIITAQYTITLLETISSLTNLEIEQLQLFPNPTSNNFEVQGPEGVTTLSIYNLLGKPIGTFVYQEGRKYDVSDFTKGLYLVALKDEKGQLLKTLRLQKF